MMLQQLFGTQLAFPIRVAIAAIVIAALLGLTVLVMRRLAGRAAGGDRRGRAGPRLSVLDSVSVDQRRRLVLVRRDEVEHLLLVGGNSDLVIEQNIGATEAVETAPAAVPPPREAPTLQRPTPRRSLSATPAAPVLAAETAAASLPAPEPVVAEAPASETREDRRSALARRPLMRGDGTLSGRPATRGADAAPEPAAPREPVKEPARDAVRVEAPRPDQARLDALKAEFAASTPKIDAPKIDAPRTEPARAEAVKIEAPKIEAPKGEASRTEPEDAPPAVSEVAAELEDLTHRLDAALVHPQPAAAAPQISLSDLLGDEPAAPAEPTPVTPTAARPEPVIEPPPPRSEGPLTRFLSQSRNRSAEARSTEARPAEVRPRPDVTPRTESPRIEAPLRPREFAFRPAGENRPLPTPEQPRREPLALRNVTREDASLRPETASPLLRAPSPTVTPPASAEVAAPVIHAPAPAQSAPHASPYAAPPVAAPPSVPHAEEAPAVEPEAPRDPLDDFDAEMANLLGRTNARSR
ncbi:flagellar biosynthetic protein FliO [Xanthobacter aminoxidans]|uniref:flagellar biosynthetic protein FliO n=1 Tax=Xanthobacter aminoxidans TaxID=186280 RepID=UPI002022E584|nr:flagellar biosynthetic protein FliO [Xanthobacter aminoxidans]MCL8381713.1 flagellar biosynthetic protein FliO [Xanthobacter aminoxidans]